MKDISRTIVNYLTTKITTLEMWNDLFPDDKTEGVIVTHDPSPRILSAFIDGTYIYQTSLSFTSRFKNPATSRDTLDKILNYLDKLKLTDSTDNLRLRITSVSNVQITGTDEKQNTYYSCSVMVEYRYIDR